MEAMTIKQLNRYIASIYASDFILQSIYVKGEISNYKESHGNYYFSLKDDEGNAIDCILFGSTLMKLQTDFNSGEEVLLKGKLSFYEKTGRTSIIVNHMEKDGIGQYYIELEKLKQKLKDMGMFDEMYKKPIPKYATHIGVVTSKTGAAIEDIKRTIYNKNPHAYIVLYPCKVQGEGAAESIIEGVKSLDEMGLDCIIVARGGGSKEDLICFNDEKLAFSIFQTKTPIISAVGHEIDVSITDLVADLRVATPTAAGEACTYSYNEFLQDLIERKEMMLDAIYRQKDLYIDKLNNYQKNIDLLSPRAQLEMKKQKLNEKITNIKNLAERKFNNILYLYESYIEKMKSCDALDKLKKGYAFVVDEKNNKVSSIKKIHINDKLKLRMQDGFINTKVEEISKV